MGGIFVVTADHGKSEAMLESDGSSQHGTYVPFLIGLLFSRRVWGAVGARGLPVRMLPKAPALHRCSTHRRHERNQRRAGCDWRWLLRKFGQSQLDSDGSKILHDTIRSRLRRRFVRPGHRPGDLDELHGGTVTSFSGTTLGVDVTATSGHGNKSSWYINLAGVPGAAGAAGTNGKNGATGATGATGPEVIYANGSATALSSPPITIGRATANSGTSGAITLNPAFTSATSCTCTVSRANAMISSDYRFQVTTPAARR
jgi:hypothetical protein